MLLKLKSEIWLIDSMFNIESELAKCVESFAVVSNSPKEFVHAPPSILTKFLAIMRNNTTLRKVKLPQEHITRELRNSAFLLKFYNKYLEDFVLDT